MIAASVLLILVAIGLLVAGVLFSSNALIICCLIVVIVAAVLLVVGVKQSVATGTRFGLDNTVDAQETGLMPALAWHGFHPRQPDSRQPDSRQPDSRINEETTLLATVPASGAPPSGALMAFPSGARSGDGGAVTASHVNVPTQSTTSSHGESPAFAEPVVVGSTYRSQVEPIADADDALVVADDRSAQGVTESDSGVGHGISPEASTVDVSGYGTAALDALETPIAVASEPDDDSDVDPADEPSVQSVTPANAARVATLTADVLVVDGRPRYHVTGCAHLNGRETEPLPVNEAVELGFTPCALCEPDSTIVANDRRV